MIIVLKAIILYKMYQINNVLRYFDSMHYWRFYQLNLRHEILTLVISWIIVLHKQIVVGKEMMRWAKLFTVKR